jgi:hypothetical protein
LRDIDIARIISKYNNVYNENRTKWVMYTVPDLNPNIICDTCKGVQPHEYVGMGEVYRKNVGFRGPTEGMVVSGTQHGDVFQCTVCKTRRIFGSGDSLVKSTDADVHDE